MAGTLSRWPTHTGRCWRWLYFPIPLLLWRRRKRWAVRELGSVSMYRGWVPVRGMLLLGTRRRSLDGTLLINAWNGLNGLVWSVGWVLLRVLLL